MSVAYLQNELDATDLSRCWLKLSRPNTIAPPYFVRCARRTSTLRFGPNEMVASSARCRISMGSRYAFGLVPPPGRGADALAAGAGGICTAGAGADFGGSDGPADTSAEGLPDAWSSPSRRTFFTTTPAAVINGGGISAADAVEMAVLGRSDPGPLGAAVTSGKGVFAGTWVSCAFGDVVDSTAGGDAQLV